MKRITFTLSLALMLGACIAPPPESDETIGSEADEITVKPLGTNDVCK